MLDEQYRQRFQSANVYVRDVVRLDFRAESESQGEEPHFGEDHTWWGDCPGRSVLLRSYETVPSAYT